MFKGSSGQMTEWAKGASDASDLHSLITPGCPSSSVRS